MKKKIASLLCVLLVIFGMPATVCASEVTPRASEYFSYTSVHACAIGNGKVCIEIDINATHMMDEVGASVVHIYEKQTNGSYKEVYKYTKAAYPNLIVEDSFFGYVDVTYQGTSGKEYYAIVGCYAKDSTGSETLYFYTNVITA